MVVPLMILCGVGLATMTPSESRGSRQTGKASFYTESKRTATGEHYDPNGLTAAHRSLPLGTVVQVRNTANGKCVTVRINDRGPFCKGRILDVSKAAAKQLDMVQSGTADVELQVQK